MIKKTFPKITSLNQTLFHVPFTSFHFLNDNTQPRFLSNNLCYNLQSWKHIHFFLLNRSTIFNQFKFYFHLEINYSFEDEDSPSPQRFSHENFLCDVGEEQSHQRSRGEEGKQR